MNYQHVISDLVAEQGLTGISFAYWDGVRLHTAIGGPRNSVTGDPVTLDTLLHIGSITKVLNATLFMQLVDDGLISLDDLVTKYVPELRLADPEALGRMTCRMLVNHTSGIDYDCPDYEDFDRQRIEVAIEDCASKTQLHPPGEATAYSNIGTVIAGYICQKLRGEGWYSLIKFRIFDPLGLDHSLADITDIPRFRVSVGDQLGADGIPVQSARPFLPLSFGPAGATIMMTATDLVTFARALINGGAGVNGTRILSEASAALMATETAKFAALPWGVGLGWILLPGGVLNHGGGGPGVASVLYAHPDTGRVFAVLTNCSNFAPVASKLVDPILATWGGLPEPAVILPATGEAAPYEGVYESQLFRYEIFADAGRLYVRTSPKVALYETDLTYSPAVELERIGDDRFEMDAGIVKMPMAFGSPDSSGKMQRLAVHVRIFNRV